VRSRLGGSAFGFEVTARQERPKAWGERYFQVADPNGVVI
jgi:uncharacterized glyoxalase superfamily protein PhnB